MSPLDESKGLRVFTIDAGTQRAGNLNSGFGSRK